MFVVKTAGLVIRLVYASSIVPASGRTLMKSCLMQLIMSQFCDVLFPKKYLVLLNIVTLFDIREFKSVPSKFSHVCTKKQQISQPQSHHTHTQTSSLGHSHAFIWLLPISCFFLSIPHSPQLCRSLEMVIWCILALLSAPVLCYLFRVTVGLTVTFLSSLYLFLSWGEFLSKAYVVSSSFYSSVLIQLGCPASQISFYNLFLN